MTTIEFPNLSAPALADSNAHLPFPPRREKVRAVWQPIYLEPMIGSDERICVGVAAANADGYIVAPASGLERFECLYGKAGSDFIRQIVEATCASLARTLETSGAHDAFADARAWDKFWAPPLQGFSMGAPCLGAGDSLEEVARNGLSLCASLVAKAVDNSAESQPSLTRTQLREDVRQIVVARNPLLAGYFGRERNLGDDVRQIKFGFVGLRLAANFAVLNSHSLSENVDYAVSRIWNLRNLQQKEFQDDLFSLERTHFELFVHTPAPNSASHSKTQLQSIAEAEGLIRVAARDSKVNLFPSDSVSAIADELLRKEAA